jgi:hypothetical protein
MPQSIFDLTDLPALKPRTHCVLIARDPNFIYAYWDFTQQDFDRARNELGSRGRDAQLVLRVYDITLVRFNGSNANHTWDLDVDGSIKNWYVHVWQDNAEYCAELGVRGDNDFIPLTRSNLAHTPPKTSSKRADLIWQDIKSHKESQPYIQEEIKDRYQGLMKQQSKKKSHQEKPAPKARVYYLTAQDIRAYYMRLFASVSRKRMSRGQAQVLGVIDVLKGIPRGVSWQKAHPLVTGPDLILRAHPGASQEFSENKGASENWLSAQAGAGSEGRLIERKFFFEIWAEVIVHGRTEPDAAVWLNEKGIKLNPDGTFSLRYSLPDGEIPFKFIAQSSDGVEQRHIYTRVEREKTIGFPKMLKDFNGQ